MARKVSSATLPSTSTSTSGFASETGGNVSLCRPEPGCAATAVPGAPVPKTCSMRAKFLRTALLPG